MNLTDKDLQIIRQALDSYEEVCQGYGVSNRKSMDYMGDFLAMFGNHPEAHIARTRERVLREISNRADSYKANEAKRKKVSRDRLARLNPPVEETT